MSTISQGLSSGMRISWMTGGPTGSTGSGSIGDVDQPDPNGLARLEAGRLSAPDPSDQVPPERVINEGDELKAFTAAKYIHGIAEFRSLADVQIVDWLLHDIESPLDSVKFRSSGKPRWWSGGPLKKFARRILQGIEGDQSHIVYAKARYVVDRYMASRSPIIYDADTLRSKLLADPKAVLRLDVPTIRKERYAFLDVDNFVSRALRNDIKSDPAVRQQIVSAAIDAMDDIRSREKRQAVAIMMQSFDDPESPMHDFTFLKGYFSAAVFHDVPVYVERIKRQRAARLRRGLREHVLMPMLVRGLRAEEIDLPQLTEAVGMQALDREHPFDFVHRVCKGHFAELHAYDFLLSRHNLSRPDAEPLGRLDSVAKARSMREKFRLIPGVLEPAPGVIFEGLAHVAIQHLWPEASLEDREDLVGQMMGHTAFLLKVLGIIVQEDGVEVPDSLRRPIVEKRDSTRKEKRISTRLEELVRLVPNLSPDPEADGVADELFAIHKDERHRRRQTLPLIEQLVMQGKLTAQTPNLYAYADRMLGDMEGEYHVAMPDESLMAAYYLDITEGDADRYLRIYTELSKLFKPGSAELIEHVREVAGGFISQVSFEFNYSYLNKHNLRAFMVVAPLLGDGGRRVVEAAVEKLRGILDGSAFEDDSSVIGDEDELLISSSIAKLRDLL